MVSWYLDMIEPGVFGFLDRLQVVAGTGIAGRWLWYAGWD